MRLTARPPHDCGEMLEINRPQPARGVTRKGPVELELHALARGQKSKSSQMTLVTMT